MKWPVDDEACYKERGRPRQTLVMCPMLTEYPAPAFLLDRRARKRALEDLGRVPAESGTQVSEIGFHVPARRSILGRPVLPTDNRPQVNNGAFHVVRAAGPLCYTGSGMWYCVRVRGSNHDEGVKAQFL